MSVLEQLAKVLISQHAKARWSYVNRVHEDELLLRFHSHYPDGQAEISGTALTLTRPYIINHFDGWSFAIILPLATCMIRHADAK